MQRQMSRQLSWIVAAAFTIGSASVLAQTTGAAGGMHESTVQEPANMHRPTKAQCKRMMKHDSERAGSTSMKGMSSKMKKECAKMMHGDKKMMHGDKMHGDDMEHGDKMSQ